MVASNSGNETDINLDDLAEGKSGAGLDRFKSTTGKDKSSNFFIMVSILAVILFLAALFVTSANIFLKASMKDKNDYTSIEQFVIEKGVYILGKYRKLLNLKEDKSINTDSEDPDVRKDTVRDYINDNGILFYDRKKSRNSWLSTQKKNIISVDVEVKKVQENISKYKYIPEEVEEFVENNRMMNILLVVEAIRIYVLGQVYDDIKYEDGVINSTYREEMVKYGEKGVEDYVQNCVLNYMTDDCSDPRSKKHDFGDELEKIIQVINENEQAELKEIAAANGGKTPSSTVQKSVDRLKTELRAAYRQAYLDSNDTEDKLKPIQMLFNNLDPKEGTLSFTLQIRLLEDYLEDDLSPSTVVKNIINLLRESHLILGTNIKLEDMHIEKRKLKIGDVTHIVNETNYEFEIDLQENIQKEIYDYKDPLKQRELDRLAAERQKALEEESQDNK